MSQPNEASARRKPLLLLLDGHAMVFRSWYAIQQPLTIRSTGEEVKGVYGFANTFLRAIRDWNPTHCAITFDSPGVTFREQQYDQYKAQRAKTPPELHQQVTHVHRLMEAFRVPIYEVAGFEADDLLGTLARQAETHGMQVVILTGDTDTFQLVTPAVRVNLYSRIQDSRVFDPDAVRERFGGLDPEKQPELKALHGDASDNIPGVPGIGDKTAIKLVLEYGSLEGIYESLAMVPARLREKLEAHREQAFLSRELGTIVVDAPVTLDTEGCRFWQYDRREVVEFLRRFEFFSIVSRVPEGATNDAASAETPAAMLPPSLSRAYDTITTLAAMDTLAQELRRAGGFALSIQASDRDSVQGHLVGMAFGVAPGRAWYVPVGHSQGEQLALEAVLERLKGVLEDPALTKIAHHATQDMTLLLRHGIQVRNVASDTMVAAHLANHKALTVHDLALDVLHEEMPPLSGLLGAGAKRRRVADVPAAELTPYIAGAADVIGRLRPLLEEEVCQMGSLDLYTKAQLPLSPVLAQMQLNGIALDVDALREMAQELGAQLTERERAIHEDVGHEFNVSSPQQLSHVLFEEMRLQRTKRTRTGAYTTDASALEGLLSSEELMPEQRRVIEALLKYRELAKLKSTYVDVLPALVNPDTGRLHTTYNQAGSATGRLASSDPNLQNIPIRTPDGRRVRRAFVAQGRPDWLLLAADYSQIELRVLAHLSRDPALLEAFQNDEDIHAATGAEMFQVPLDAVTADMRRIAKVLNFGVIYGLSAFGVAQQTEFSVNQGAQFIESYFQRYPGVQRYVEQTRERVRSDGYVETLMGRRRYLPEVTSSNIHLRQAAERMAINMPVQGTAAEIIELAMIDVHRWMEECGVRSKMLLQVHDELIFEVPQEEVEEMKAMVLKLMPAAMELAVPLKVDLKQGETWGDME